MAGNIILLAECSDEAAQSLAESHPGQQGLSLDDTVRQLLVLLAVAANKAGRILIKGLAPLHQHPPPAVWGRVHEHAECRRRVRRVLFAPVQLQPGVEHEGHAALQPCGVVFERGRHVGPGVVPPEGTDPHKAAELLGVQVHLVGLARAGPTCCHGRAPAWKGTAGCADG